MRRKIVLLDDSLAALFLERTLPRGAAFDLIEALDGAQAMATARRKFQTSHSTFSQLSQRRSVLRGNRLPELYRCTLATNASHEESRT